MLAPVMPAVTGNGLAMRVGLFFEALTRVADVDLVVAPLFGLPKGNAAAWPQSRGAQVRVLDLGDAADTHFTLIMRLKDPSARAHAFADFGKPTLAACLSSKAIAQVADLLNGDAYNLVHASRSYCAPFALELADKVTRTRRPVLTLDLDEDDCRVFHGLAELAGRQGRHDEQRWRVLEGNAFRRLVDANAQDFDRIWIASQVDASRLHKRSTGLDLRVVPNAVDARPSPRRHDDGRTLLFVGSLGYEPNQDAVKWLLGAIWPKLKRWPGLRLRIAGPNAPESLRRLAGQRNVEMLGWVPVLRRCYESATLTVAPIRVGAGTRIKLLESAIHGVSIVTTPLGAEGLNLKDGQHLWLAKDAVAFTAAVAYALARPAERRRRAHQARAYVGRNFGWQGIVAQLSQEFLGLM
jgi:glycosyltransferase involved in cell wall biosynthesis